MQFVTCPRSVKILTISLWPCQGFAICFSSAKSAHVIYAPWSFSLLFENFIFLQFKWLRAERHLRRRICNRASSVIIQPLTPFSAWTWNWLPHFSARPFYSAAFANANKRHSALGRWLPLTSVHLSGCPRARGLLSKYAFLSMPSTLLLVQICISFSLQTSISLSSSRHTPWKRLERGQNAGDLQKPPGTSRNLQESALRWQAFRSRHSGLTVRLPPERRSFPFGMHFRLLSHSDSHATSKSAFVIFLWYPGNIPHLLGYAWHLTNAAPAPHSSSHFGQPRICLAMLIRDDGSHGT